MTKKKTTTATKKKPAAQKADHFWTKAAVTVDGYYWTCDDYDDVAIERLRAGDDAPPAFRSAKAIAVVEPDAPDRAGMVVDSINTSISVGDSVLLSIYDAGDAECHGTDMIDGLNATVTKATKKSDSEVEITIVVDVS